MEPISVFITKLETLVSEKEELLSKLKPEDLERYNRYRQEEDKLRFLGGRALIYKHVGSPIQLEEKGKPFVAGEKHFSISHSGDYVAIALDEAAPLGVDIECRSEASQSLVEHVCSEPEIDFIKKHGQDSFFEIWTKKEALIKCTGTGMTVSLKSIDVTKEGKFEYMGHVFCVCHTTFDGYHLSVCSAREFDKILIQQETQIV